MIENVPLQHTMLSSADFKLLRTEVLVGTLEPVYHTTVVDCAEPYEVQLAFIQRTEMHRVTGRAHCMDQITKFREIKTAAGS